MRKPGPVKTHMAFRSSLYSKDAKYIYEAGNPYDYCVSSFYHTKDMAQYGFQAGTFDQFFNMLVRGEVEQLKENTATWVLRIADFIGKQHGQKLRTDADLFGNVLTNTDVESVKERMNESMQNLFVDDGIFTTGKVP
ncbi:hypothetical protein MTO96_026482 [Rhipicephalus appendiculatus]